MAGFDLTTEELHAHFYDYIMLEYFGRLVTRMCSGAVPILFQTASSSGCGAGLFSIGTALQNEALVLFRHAFFLPR
jgi:hypothetical protein